MFGPRSTSTDVVLKGPYNKPEVLQQDFSVMCTDLPLSPSTDDPLAVRGAGNGRHSHVVCVVNDEHGLTAFRRKHTDLTVIPR